MTNIVLIARDRPRLTHQCLTTLYENTAKDSFNLVIIDDGSKIETQTIIRGWAETFGDNCEVVTFLKPIGIVGFLRNVGVWASERFFGRGDYLYCSDNDIAFLPRWLPRMEGFIDRADLIGGCRHPYHQPQYEVESFGDYGNKLHVVDAVSGYSHFMKWSTWDKYGPYDQHAKGIGQSEDWALCNKIVKDGGRVGYVFPDAMAHTGITNSDGKPATGAESFPRITGVIYE